MTSDIARIDVSTTDSAAEVGAQSASTDIAFDGVVTSTSRASFTVRTAGPDASDNGDVRVTVDAPGLDLAEAIVRNALAHVHYTKHCSLIGCSSDVVVTSLDSLDGIRNPSPARSGLYVAADDGGGLMKDAPFQVEHVRLSCVTELPGGCGGEVPGLFGMRFTAGAAEAFVRMGDTERFALGDGYVRARNLRSFLEGYCNDNVNWAHWVASAE